MVFPAVGIYIRPRLFSEQCACRLDNIARNSTLSVATITSPEHLLLTIRWPLRTVSQTTGPVLCSTCNKTCPARNFKTHSKFKNILPTLSMTQRGVFKHGHLCWRERWHGPFLLLKETHLKYKQMGFDTAAYDTYTSKLGPAKMSKISMMLQTEPCTNPLKSKF